MSKNQNNNHAPIVSLVTSRFSLALATWLALIIIVLGCKHAQIDEKGNPPKMQFKNDKICDINTWK
jgi:hypothetical protein